MSKKSDRIVDYYKKFHLDPNLTAEELVNKLRSMQGERMRQSSIKAFDYELQAEIEKELKEFESAIKIFERSKEKYDLDLARAYKEGKIDEENQRATKNFLDDLDALLRSGNYGIAIQKCKDALGENMNDPSIYKYLAMANYGAGNKQEAFNVLTSTLTQFPNDFASLRLGARYSADIEAYEYSQGYLNRMLEVYPDRFETVSDQCYLYEKMDKDDIAFKLIDEYLEKNPNDQEFRRACAYDLVNLSHDCYIEDSSSGAMIIAEQDKYEKCVAICNKAAEIYKDETTESVLENAKFFGKTEYNRANLKSTILLFISGLIYFIPGFGVFLVIEGNIMTGILTLLGALQIYSGIRLTQVSFRPYWQINKFFMTGKRERSEQFYVRIGNILAAHLIWSWKLGWKITWAMIRFIVYGFGSGARK